MMITVVPPWVSVMIPWWNWSTVVVSLAQIECKEAALVIHRGGGSSTKEDSTSEERCKAHIKEGVWQRASEDLTELKLKQSTPPPLYNRSCPCIVVRSLLFLMVGVPGVMASIFTYLCTST